MLTQKNAVFTIPNVFEWLLEPFTRLFSVQVWSHAQVLLWGAILGRYNQQHGEHHKYLIDWARQMLKQVRRWLLHRSISAPSISLHGYGRNSPANSHLVPLRS